MQEIIKIAGVGGGGINALNCMIRNDIKGVEFIAIDTDIRHLESSLAQRKIALRDTTKRGEQCGGLETGWNVAMESRDIIKDALLPAEMIVICAGLGGETATGASPVIAGMAKETGALTVSLVSMPLCWEGLICAKLADEGISRIKEHSDALIIIPSDDMFEYNLGKYSCFSEEEIFDLLDNALSHSIRGITDMLLAPGMVNIHFSDIRCLLTKAGTVAIGIGEGKGENCVAEAADHAINSSMMWLPMPGAKKVLFQVATGPDIGLHQITEAAEAISNVSGVQASIMWGHAFDTQMYDSARVTIMAGDFECRASVAQSSALSYQRL
jgi:cell division protein FtsZ